MLVHPSVPAKTVPSEFIAYAKANPGEIQHGVGRHQKCDPSGRELFQVMTLVDIISCALSSAHAATLVLPDLLGGQCNLFRQPAGHHRAHPRRPLRALAVNDSTRRGLAGRATVGHFAAGLRASQLFVVGLPSHEHIRRAY